MDEYKSQKELFDSLKLVFSVKLRLIKKDYATMKEATIEELSEILPKDIAIGFKNYLEENS